jgi:hypothetical protein
LLKISSGKAAAAHIHGLKQNHKKEKKRKRERKKEKKNLKIKNLAGLRYGVGIAPSFNLPCRTALILYHISKLLTTGSGIFSAIIIK